MSLLCHRTDTRMRSCCKRVEPLTHVTPVNFISGYKYICCNYTPISIFFAYLIQIPSTLYHTIPTFNNPQRKALENIVEKGENAGNQHFLLFPQCFLSFLKQVLIFHSTLFCRLQMLSI